MKGWQMIVAGIVWDFNGEAKLLHDQYGYSAEPIPGVPYAYRMYKAVKRKSNNEKNR